MSLTDQSEETGWSRATVVRALARLESVGLVERIREPYRATIYRLHQSHIETSLTESLARLTQRRG
jgi:DNA-binding MarR family transcriptional regulator